MTGYCKYWSRLENTYVLTYNFPLDFQNYIKMESLKKLLKNGQDPVPKKWIA